MLERTFPIAPVSSAPLLFLGGIGLLLLVVIGLLALTAYSMKNARFEVTDQGLQIRASLYSRSIPREQIVTAGAKVINLNTETQYRPRLKTNGTGLPDYREGWFRLRNSDLPPSKLGGIWDAPPQVRTRPLSSPQQAEGYPACFL